MVVILGVLGVLKLLLLYDMLLLCVDVYVVSIIGSSFGSRNVRMIMIVWFFVVCFFMLLF